MDTYLTRYKQDNDLASIHVGSCVAMYSMEHVHSEGDPDGVVAQ